MILYSAAGTQKAAVMLMLMLGEQERQTENGSVQTRALRVNK